MAQKKLTQIIINPHKLFSVKRFEQTALAKHETSAMYLTSFVNRI